jgi:hypothetical protein
LTVFRISGTSLWDSSVNSVEPDLKYKRKRAAAMGWASSAVPNRSCICFSSIIKGTEGAAPAFVISVACLGSVRSWAPDGLEIRIFPVCPSGSGRRTNRLLPWRQQQEEKRKRKEKAEKKTLKRFMGSLL